MARMTGTDMTGLIREFLGGPPTDQITDATILRCINLSYRNLAVQTKDPRCITSFNITTSSGTASYEYASGGANTFDVLEVVDTTNDQRLEQINIMQYNMYTQGDTTTTTGNPYYYHMQGVGTTYPKMWFYPTPDGTYTITVYVLAYPTELAAGTSSILHEGLDEPLMWNAAAKAAAIMQDTERFNMATKLYQDGMSAAVSQVKTEASMPVYGRIGLV